MAKKNMGSQRTGNMQKPEFLTCLITMLSVEIYNYKLRRPTLVTKNAQISCAQKFELLNTSPFRTCIDIHILGL